MPDAELPDAELMRLLKSIADGDEGVVQQILGDAPELATARLSVGASRSAPEDFFLCSISHHVYAGETALHVAAAAHQPHTIAVLVELGADVLAVNRRGAGPLHYAADGIPDLGSSGSDQRTSVEQLLAAGGDPNAQDKGGATPLHRAVRGRCAGAVRALLDHGADICVRNARGSTPLQVAQRNTGRGGTGTPEAKAAQREIIELLFGREQQLADRAD